MPPRGIDAAPAGATELPRKILHPCQRWRPEFVYISVDGSGEFADGVLTQLRKLASAVDGTAGITAGEFDGIVLANQRRIFRLLYSLVRDHDTADTLTQECFLRAFRKRHSFRGEASVTTWLVRIATNLARDYSRNQRLAFWRKLFRGSRDQRGETQPIEIPDPMPSPERVLLVREQLESVWAVMEQLPHQQRTAFALRFASDMSLGEIAGVVDLEVGTVKAHLYRAICAVKKGVRGQEKS